MTRARVRMNAVLCALVALPAFAGCTVLFMPRFLERVVIPSVAMKAGIGGLSVGVRSVGFGRADLADVRATLPGQLELRIDSVRADYRLRDLVRRHLHGLSVGGVAIGIPDRAVTAGGENVAAAKRAQAARGAGGARPASPARFWTIGSCQVRNVTVRGGDDTRRGMALAVEKANGSVARSAEGAAVVTMTVALSAGQISVRADLDGYGGRALVRARLDGPGGRLSPLDARFDFRGRSLKFASAPVTFEGGVGRAACSSVTGELTWDPNGAAGGGSPAGGLVLSNLVVAAWGMDLSAPYASLDVRQGGERLCATGGVERVRCSFPGGAATGSVWFAAQNRIANWRVGLATEGAPTGLCAKAHGLIELRTNSFRGWFEADVAAGRDAVDVGLALPEAAGTLVKGQLVLSGSGEWRTGGMDGSVRAWVNDGSVRNEKADVTVEGIAASLRMADPFEAGLSGAQEVWFRAARVGHWGVEDGSAVFRLESGALLVESASCRWCGGNVHAYAVRLTPDMESATLFCDRVDLAEVMREFGAASGSGTGRVTGRIPMRVRKSSLLVDDGLLQSSAGQKGRIQLGNLTRAVAAGGGTELALAAKALEDFEYDWAVLAFGSEGDALKMSLKLSGRPMEPLPFKINRETGAVVQVESGEDGARFQGLQLDLNFRIPINDLIRYAVDIGRVRGGR